MAVVPSRPLPPGIPENYNEARRLFETVTAGLKCRDVIHTTANTCTGAVVDMCGGCLLGSVKYFFPFYLVHIIWNARKAISGDKEFYTDLAHCYARSVMFGGAMGSIFSIVSCTMSRSIGGFSFWSSMFIPGACAGLSIFIDHINRRRIVMNTFYNMALEYLYVRAQIAGIVRRSAAVDTIAFMVINAMLLSLLHKGSTRKKKTPVFWFFIPESERTEISTSTQDTCPVPHKDTCWRSTLQATTKYSALAGALQALRVVMGKGSIIAKDPTTFFREFFSKRTGASILSVGGYVFLYKVARCALALRYESDNYQHSALAGLAAGTAFWLQPNTTILTSALIATIRLLLDYLPRQLKALREWPMPEVLFALCNGILFHARCMDMAHCPRFVIHMMDTATRNRSNTIYNTYLKLINSVQLKT